MKDHYTIVRFSVLFSLLFLPLVSVGAQALGPDDTDAGTEDTVCVEKNYRHKTARELERMTPEQLVNESVKEWNYHVKLLDEYGMFTLTTYTEKIGVAIIPVLTKTAVGFAAHPLSKCRQARFFKAFAIAADVDNQIVRLRSREDGQAAISAAAKAVQRMEAAGLADQDARPYNKHPFGMYLLERVHGINEHDELMRELLAAEFGLRLPDEQFIDFVKFLTSTDPAYPSWSPRVDSSRDLRPNKKKYHDAYLQFRKTVRTSNFHSNETSDRSAKGRAPRRNIGRLRERG